jgi:hypothetical protein
MKQKTRDILEKSVPWGIALIFILIVISSLFPPKASASELEQLGVIYETW